MGALTLNNTLTGEKEEFKPLRAGEVSMYNCGPTVYNYLHIGNLRTFVMNDVLRRTLEWNGFKVNQVMNVTDVEDKMIEGAKRDGVSVPELAKKYENAFLSDIKDLNIETPTHMPHATEYVPKMVDAIAKLIDSGYAYKTEDGIYFDIAKSKNYGKIANLEHRTETKSRIATDEYNKEHPNDFALWKFAKPEDGDMKWSAPFGEGRPGWHIECSVMAQALLGKTIDIHTGAIDLIFPHHTNEIAQSEALTGKEFVKFFVHGGFLNVGEDKMAKSAGNFIKLSDLKEKGIHPLSYRYFVLGARFETPLTFSEEAVQGAHAGFAGILHEVVSLLRHGKENGEASREYLEKFGNFVNDNLDTPKALALLHELLKSNLAPDEKLGTISEFDKVLGLNILTLANGFLEIPKEINTVHQKREEVRKAKDWKKADELRKEIESKGFQIFDMKEGGTIEKTLASLISK